MTPAPEQMSPQPLDPFWTSDLPLDPGRVPADALAKTFRLGTVKAVSVLRSYPPVIKLDTSTGSFVTKVHDPDAPLEEVSAEVSAALGFERYCQQARVLMAELMTPEAPLQIVELLGKSVLVQTNRYGGSLLSPPSDNTHRSPAGMRAIGTALGSLHRAAALRKSKPLTLSNALGNTKTRVADTPVALRLQALLAPTRAGFDALIEQAGPLVTHLTHADPYKNLVSDGRTVRLIDFGLLDEQCLEIQAIHVLTYQLTEGPEATGAINVTEYLNGYKQAGADVQKIRAVLPLFFARALETEFNSRLSDTSLSGAGIDFVASVAQFCNNPFAPRDPIHRQIAAGLDQFLARPPREPPASPSHRLDSI